MLVNDDKRNSKFDLVMCQIVMDQTGPRNVKWSCCFEILFQSGKLEHRYVPSFKHYICPDRSRGRSSYCAVHRNRQE